jgi:hypothetical protein
MHKIDSDGSVAGYFTEGDPESLIAATIVSDLWLNAVQKEITSAIVLGGNIPLLTSGTETGLQLLAAIQTMINKGGQRNPFKFTLTNNVAVATNVTGIIYDKLVTLSARLSIDILRRTDSANFREVGDIFMIYDPELDVWNVTGNTFYQDAGIVFTATSAGQLQYTSSNMAGASYSGFLRVVQAQQCDLDQTLLAAP